MPSAAHTLSTIAFLEFPFDIFRFIVTFLWIVRHHC
jgi:hypothetical protein